jgi:hypothetical protein
MPKPTSSPAIQNHGTPTRSFSRLMENVTGSFPTHSPSSSNAVAELDAAKNSREAMILGKAGKV